MPEAPADADINAKFLVVPAAIETVAATGEKPTQIAGWLHTLGFVGTGATVNGFFTAFDMRRR